MKTRMLIVACMALTFAGTGIQAQNKNNQNRQEHAQFDDHDQQVTRDWYKQHQSNAPTGLRTQDRLPADQESKLQRGNVIPRDLQKQEHPIPRDLSRQLPPPPRNSRYVGVGGHVAQIDKSQHVQDVIHLELNF